MADDKPAFSLQGIFDDDTHTPKDGAYFRLLRTRKWLYAASLGSLALDYKWISMGGLSKILPIVNVPQSEAVRALAIMTGYFFAIYTFVTFQYFMTLKESFAARVDTRSLEELTNWTRSAAEAEGTLAPLRNRMTQLTASMQSIPQNGAPGIQLKRQGYAAEISTLEPQVKSLEEKLQALSAKIASFKQEGVRGRLALGFSEAAIDAIRLLPPLALATVALSAAFLKLR